MHLPKCGWLAISMVFMGCTASEASVGESEQLANEQATVHFKTSGWAPTWSGNVRAGGELEVDYDFARLPQCRNQGRVVSWVVEVSYRFDGGEIHTAALSGSPGASETLPNSKIAIPESAHSIELWFENRAVGGYDHCTAWDSQFGANYTHSL